MSQSSAPSSPPAERHNSSEMEPSQPFSAPSSPPQPSEPSQSSSSSAERRAPPPRRAAPPSRKGAPPPGVAPSPSTSPSPSPSPVGSPGPGAGGEVRRTRSGLSLGELKTGNENGEASPGSSRSLKNVNSLLTNPTAPGSPKYSSQRSQMALISLKEAQKKFSSPNLDAPSAISAIRPHGRRMSFLPVKCNILNIANTSNISSFEEEMFQRIFFLSLESLGLDDAEAKKMADFAVSMTLKSEPIAKPSERRAKLELLLQKLEPFLDDEEPTPPHPDSASRRNSDENDLQAPDHSHEVDS